MTHKATASFWNLYSQLPLSVQRIADKNYQLLEGNPYHPSLHFKEVKEDVWSVRASSQYRALAILQEGIFYWFWIGTHAEYDHLIK